MQAYRCFLLDGDGRFAKVVALDCGTDEHAEQRCREILNETHHPQAELWRGSKFVKRWANSRDGEGAAGRAHQEGRTCRTERDDPEAGSAGR